MQLYTKLSTMFTKRPMLGSITITSSGFLCGDIICQCIEHKYTEKKTFQWDMKRSLNFTTIGVVIGPFFHFMIPFVVSVFPGTGTKIALQRAVFGQIVFAPFASGLVLSLNTILDGGNMNSVRKRLQNDWFDVYIRQIFFFLPGQFINYWIIPMQYRVLWLNFIGFNWRIFLSYLVFSRNKNIDLKSETT
eukprot:530074_1